MTPQPTTLILAWLLGVVGAAPCRFGQIAPGILKLITQGGCGIWAPIDLGIAGLGNRTDLKRNPSARVEASGWETSTILGHAPHVISCNLSPPFPLYLNGGSWPPRERAAGSKAIAPLKNSKKVRRKNQHLYGSNATNRNATV